MSYIALSISDLEFHGVNAVRKVGRCKNRDFSVFVFGSNRVSVDIRLCGTRVDTRRIGLFRVFRNGNCKIHTIVNDGCVIVQFNGIGHTCRSIRNIAENRGFTVIHNGGIVNRYIIDEECEFASIRFCFIVFPSAVFDIPFNHGTVVTFRLVTVFGRSIGKTVVLHGHGIVAGESGKIGIEIIPSLAAHALAFNEKLVHCGRTARPCIRRSLLVTENETGIKARNIHFIGKIYPETETGCSGYINIIIHRSVHLNAVRILCKAVRLYGIGVVCHHGRYVVFIIRELAEINGICHRMVARMNFSVFRVRNRYNSRDICVIIVECTPTVNTRIFKIENNFGTFSDIKRNGCADRSTDNRRGYRTAARNGSIGSCGKRKSVYRTELSV